MILLLLLDGVGVNSLLELESETKKNCTRVGKDLVSDTYLVPIWYLSGT